MEIKNCQDQTEGLHTPRREMRGGGGIEHVDLRVGGHCRATHKVWRTYVSNKKATHKYQLNSLHKLSYLIPTTTLGSQIIISYLFTDVFRLAKKSFT